MLMTGDQILLKQLNRTALLWLLRTRPGLARVELARLTHLTKATVGSLVDELRAEGWLLEGETLASRAGRPSTPLFLDPSRLAVLGAELRPGGHRLVAVDLLGNLLLSRAVLCPYPTLEDAVGGVKDALKLFQLEPVLEGRTVLGLGLAASSPLLGPEVFSEAPASEGTASLHTLLEPLAESGFPVMLEQTPLAAALGEYLFGEATGPFLYLHGGQEMRGGMVLEDHLLRGYQGRAGDLGSVLLEQGVQGGGRVNDLIGLGNVVREAGIEFQDVDSAVDALREKLERGDPRALEAVRRAGVRLGQLTALLTCMVNPRVCVLDGPLGELGPELLEAVHLELSKQLGAEQAEALLLRPSRNGLDTPAVGAAALMLHALTRPARTPVMSLLAKPMSRRSRTR